MAMATNNTSGMTGVNWCKREQRWKASIRVNKKDIGLGYFIEKEDAIAARKAGEEKHAEAMKSDRIFKHETEEGRHQARLSDYTKCIKRRKKENPKAVLLSNIRYTAKLRGLEFNLDISDIEIKDHCECCGERMYVFQEGKGSNPPNSQTTDRLDNNKGYIKGNIDFICYACNTMKGDCDDPEELQKIVDYMRRCIEKIKNRPPDFFSWEDHRRLLEKNERRKGGPKAPRREIFPVRCLNDGKIYESATIAGEFYNLTKLVVQSHCRKGTQTRDGLRFAYTQIH